jgi:hypothetical protein
MGVGAASRISPALVQVVHSQGDRARGCRTHGERAAEREVEADQVALRIDALRAQGRSWSEIAAALGISAGAARQRLRRLKNRRADRETAAAAGEAA